MIKERQTLKRQILKFTSDLALKQAERSANSACVFWHYQPKMPNSVKKMRKF